MFLFPPVHSQIFATLAKSYHGHWTISFHTYAHWSRMKPFRWESPKIQLHQMGFLSFPCLNMDLFALLNVIYILWNLSFSAIFISNMIHKMSSALKKCSFMQRTPMNYVSYGSKISLKTDFLTEKSGEIMFYILFALSVMLTFA